MLSYFPGWNRRRRTARGVGEEQIRLECLQVNGMIILFTLKLNLRWPTSQIGLDWFVIAVCRLKDMDWFVIAVCRLKDTWALGSCFYGLSLIEACNLRPCLPQPTWPFDLPYPTSCLTWYDLLLYFTLPFAILTYLLPYLTYLLPYLTQGCQFSRGGQKRGEIFFSHVIDFFTMWRTTVRCVKGVVLVPLDPLGLLPMFVLGLLM